MKKLLGKIALITGGTTGIGAATAKLFQTEGATVIVTGSNPVTLKAAQAGMAGIDVIASDAGNTGAIIALLDTIKSRYGRIDVLFVNAAVGLVSAASTVTEQEFDALFNVNVRGAFFLIKHVAEIMPEYASIVLTSSVSGAQGSPYQTVYGASKAAVRSLGRSFARELASRNIRVNTISPGPIETPGIGKVGLTFEQLAAIAQEKVPLGRSGQPEEVASVALFFASADSSFVTGAELFVDGGLIEL